MSNSSDASESAARVAELLRGSGRRLVLAESCTGGLVAATLAQGPGISEHLCGSAVVYRTATKSAWLGIDPVLLDDPQIGPVSQEVTGALALAVLDRTPEADLSAAVTGHLGPNAPPELDGVVYIAVAQRDAVSHVIFEQRHLLEANGGDPATIRRRRQQAATLRVLNAVIDAVTPT